MEAFLYNWTSLLDKDIGAMWAYMEEDKICGMLGGVLLPGLNDGELTATECFWYVLPEHRGSSGGIRLIREFQAFAKKMGAKRIIMASLTSSPVCEKVERLYEGLGFKLVERHYLKTL